MRYLRCFENGAFLTFRIKRQDLKKVPAATSFKISPYGQVFILSVLIEGKAAHQDTHRK